MDCNKAWNSGIRQRFRNQRWATIPQSLRVGPYSCRLDGTLDAANSSAPFRNRTKAFDTARPSQGLEQAKYRALFSPNLRRKPGPKGPSAELIHAVVEMKQRNPNWRCPRIAQQIALAFRIQIDKDVVRRILAPSPPAWTGLRWSLLADGSSLAIRSRFCC